MMEHPTWPRLQSAATARALCTWVLCTWALAPGPAQAATVQVTVLAADGQALPDAVVVLEPKAGGATRKPVPVQATIQQEKSRFMPALIVVPTGSRVRFTNLDSYEHHVRGRAAGAGLLDTPTADKGFELRLSAAADGRSGGSQEVVVASAGPMELGCHLHSVMRGHIYVADSPWVAKTDSNGNATLSDVPEGAAHVRVWHGDQLLPAAPVNVSVLASTTLSLPTQVTPRGKRRR